MLESTAMPGLQTIETVFDRDELAERELLQEMVSVTKAETGIDNVIWISPKGNTRHAPRIKLAIDPRDSFDPRGETASIMIDDGKVVAGDVSAGLRNEVKRFLDLNRDVLLDYWDYRIGTKELLDRLRSIEGQRPD